MGLNNLHLSIFETFPHQNLKNRLNLKLEIKQVPVFVNNLNFFVVPFGVWHKNGARGPVDVVVRLELVLIDLISVV